jgi:Transposase DDE domain
MTTLSLTRDDDWQTLLGYLPSEYVRLAVEHKQLQTQYGNAKITTAESLLRFILLHVGANLPLLQTVTLIAEAGGPRLSAMRLHMKMRRAAPYLQALVERMTPWRAEAKAEQWAGYSMVLVDATTVCGPGATGTDARVHTKLRVADMAIVEAEVTDEHVGESFKRFLFHPGELAIGDRIYCNAPNIAYVVEHGADVLVRFNGGSLPPLQLAHGGTLDALAASRALREGAVLDLPVTYEHGDERIRGRFISTPLPRAEAEEARKRLRKERGANVSPEVLESAGYVMLLTTVPRERMAASKCLLAYRLRWQVELQFKRWKSLCGFDRLPNYRDDTIVAWLYAKLLLGVLLDRMSADRTELSPPVQLEAVPRQPRRPRRRRAAAPGEAALEAHEHPVSDDRRGPPAAVSA